MKPAILFLSLFLAACQSKHERFLRESSAFPQGYVGRWQSLSSMGGPQLLQAGITIKTSGDSLLWQYFSQIVDTTTNRKIACSPQMDFMPVDWDDSLRLARADHGVNQGYNYDNLRLTGADQLQMNSFSLASFCHGPLGFNKTQLTFFKVTSFRYEP